MNSPGFLEEGAGEADEYGLKDLNACLFLGIPAGKTCGGGEEKESLVDRIESA